MINESPEWIQFKPRTEHKLTPNRTLQMLIGCQAVVIVVIVKHDRVQITVCLLVYLTV